MTSMSCYKRIETITITTMRVKGKGNDVVDDGDDYGDVHGDDNGCFFGV